MELIKSKRITSLSIINKNKEKQLLLIMNSYKNIKNQISYKLNQNHNYQNDLFKNNKLSSYYKYYKNENYNNIYLLSWEIQKFVNDDLILKDKERISRFFNKYKSKLFQYKIIKYKSGKTKEYKKIFKLNQTKLSKCLEMLVKYEYYKYNWSKKYVEDFKKELIILFNNFSFKKKKRLIKLKNKIINRYKYQRKSITYTTGSIIKTNQKELGKNYLRLIKDEQNKKYQYYYCFDYRIMNEDNQKIEKKVIKIPLRFKEQYHKNLKLYTNSLGNNKFKKNKIKKDNEYIKIFTKNREKYELKNLLNIEHQISLSTKNRLNVTLTYKTNHKIKNQRKSKLKAFDVGGSKKNSLVSNEKEIIQFHHLDKIIKKLNEVDKLPNKTKEEIEYKGHRLSKILRENVFYINKEIKKYLDKCEKEKVNEIIFEELEQWNVKWYNKEEGEKYNRIFRLIRTRGLVELFKKQRRNRGILINTIPSYYTSQRCSCCGYIDKNNRSKDNVKKFECLNCGNKEHRDHNARKNIKYIFERFSNIFCVKNKFNEYERKKYLKKDFVFNILNEDFINKNINKRS